MIDSSLARRRDFDDEATVVAGVIVDPAALSWHWTCWAAGEFESAIRPLMTRGAPPDWVVHAAVLVICRRRGSVGPTGRSR